MVIAGIVIGLVLLLIVGVYLAARLSSTAVTAITWGKGERWVRFSPNPGYRISDQKQWSKAYGKGRR